MKINYKWITSLSLSTVLLLNPLTSMAQTLTKEDVLYETVSTQVLSDGVTYEERSKLTADGWVDLFVLKMDTQNPNVALDIIRSETGWGVRESLTNLAATNPSIVGAVNATFFDMSKNVTDIIGTEYEGDYASVKKFYNVGAQGAANLIETEGSGMLFDFLGATIHLTNEEGRELYITGINTLSDLTGAMIFNSVAFKNSAQVDALAKGYKIVVQDGLVIDVAPPERIIDVPEGGYFIWINETLSSVHVPYFPVGKYINLSITNTVNRDDLKLAISGGGLILKAGQVVAPGFVVEPNKRNPRSAVGLTSDGRYLITMVVDGRGSSIGATHAELANYLLEYSVTDAMHFDGGGSSEMVARSLGDTKTTIVNTPSDGTQRKVVNGLGIVSKAPAGTTITLEIKPSSSKVFINMPVRFDVVAYDEYKNPVVVSASDLILVNKGITGKWTNTTFTPTTIGEGKIECQYKGYTATATVTCVDTYIDLDISPKSLQINPGQTGKFTLIGTDATGYKGGISSANVTWKVSDPNLGSFVDGVFVAKSLTGVTKVVASANGREISAYVVIGSEKSPVTSFEDTLVSSVNYPETVVGVASASNEQAVDGQKSIKLAYHFTPTDITQATYAVLQDVKIESRVQSLGISVYGDNSLLMLRGKLVDVTGAAFNITFTSAIDFTGWKYLEASVPSEVVYPLQVERLYAAALASDIPRDGNLYMDGLMQNKYFDTSSLKGEEKYISDPLISTGSQANDFIISVFGTTAGRNRLLDDVVLQKAYDNMKSSSLAMFAGKSNVVKSKVTAPSLIWDDRFSVNDYANVRIVHLATNEGGLVKSDASQWKQIASTLANTVQNNIIIVGNLNPQKVNNFTDQREGDLLHSVLSTYKQKTNKNIFYLNASGYKMNADLKDGIRYIDLNGLWYNVGSDRKVDLNNAFNMLEFYVHGDTMNYAIKNLYPIIEIGQ
ncbi:MAG: phosphodiester glycosidase family protein [Vallitaleaceae bacterium]|nr:phosphodiester glycosidase family protein [Vallitaleaceae bacterium]